MALGVITEQANSSKSRYILIDITLYLPHSNRKVTALLNSETEKALISQYFAKENKLQATPVRRMGIAVDRH
jgi:hypothetical protein